VRSEIRKALQRVRSTRVREGIGHPWWVHDGHLDLAEFRTAAFSGTYAMLCELPDSVFLEALRRRLDGAADSIGQAIAAELAEAERR
jgi:hypothetical protein